MVPQASCSEWRGVSVLAWAGSVLCPSGSHPSTCVGCSCPSPRTCSVAPHSLPRLGPGCLSPQQPPCLTVLGSLPTAPGGGWQTRGQAGERQGVLCVLTDKSQQWESQWIWKGTSYRQFGSTKAKVIIAVFRILMSPFASVKHNHVDKMLSHLGFSSHVLASLLMGARRCFSRCSPGREVLAFQLMLMIPNLPLVDFPHPNKGGKRTSCPGSLALHLLGLGCHRGSRVLP